MPHPLASPPTHQSYFSLSIPSLYPGSKPPPMSQAPPQGATSTAQEPSITDFIYTMPRPICFPPTNHRLRLHDTTPRRATPTSLQTPPLSEHQGEAGLMTAPTVLKWWGAGLLLRCPGNGRGRRELRQREGSGRALSGTVAARGPCPAPPAPPPPAHLPPCPHP